MKTEHQEQREFVQWFRQNYSPLRIFAIPNGGGRSMSEGARLKAEGVSPGVPDLFIPSLRMFIEMKREKRGRVSDFQKDWIMYLEKAGYRCFVCHGQEEAKGVVEKYVKGQ